MNYILNDYYNSGDIKFGDLINSKFTEDQRKAIDEFQVYKYLWRYKSKNGKDDLIKAKYYLDDLIRLLTIDYDNELPLDWSEK
jgi:hypothetical protein